MLYNLKKCFPTYLSGRWDRVNRLLSNGSIPGSLLPVGMHTREGVVPACKLPPGHCTVRKMEAQRSWVTFSEESSSQASLLKPSPRTQSLFQVFPQGLRVLVWNLTCMMSTRGTRQSTAWFGDCESLGPEWTVPVGQAIFGPGHLRGGGPRLETGQSLLSAWRWPLVTFLLMDKHHCSR